jgi:hypothetical protein
MSTELIAATAGLGAGALVAFASRDFAWLTVGPLVAPVIVAAFAVILVQRLAKQSA